MAARGRGNVVDERTTGDGPIETVILAVDGSARDAAAIERAASVIRAGGLVAFPTETVYGLGADARSTPAVRKIYLAKRRAPEDPCIVHIAALGDLPRVVAISAAAPETARRVEALAAAFWPGPLSLILPRATGIPDQVTAGRPTVAVRMPAHPVALALIRAAGVPIAAPSANLFMHTSPTTAAHVLCDLGGRIDLILDGGPAVLGVESTVLDLTGETPTVLRPGGVSIEQVHDVLGIPLQPARARNGHMSVDEQHGLPAPGMMDRHYAPQAEVLLFDGPPPRVRAALAQRARALLAEGRRVGALLPDEDARALQAEERAGLLIARLGAARDARAVAQRLYAGMRELEAAGVEVILARIVEGEGLARAIQDRLRRAAANRIIDVC
jgi:L-threonylcarbamoyladenylate synthase